MSTSRKQYQKVWIAKKRKAIRLLKAATEETSESSDSSDSNQTDIRRILASETQINHESSGEISEDDGDAWSEIDRVCTNKCVSDSSESDSDTNDGKDLASELRTWAVDSGVTHSQLNKLLPILRKTKKSLPLTANTLLRTADVVECGSRSGGDYLYFGVKVGLENLFRCVAVDELCLVDEVQLAFNIDGVPLFVSSTYSLWPILCYAMNVKPQQVFVVALYGGKSKPSDLTFIQDTVNELNSLISDGILIEGRRLTCMLKMCVCDAPARAMVKAIKQFSGYYGCDKCLQKGYYVGRMTYPQCTAPLRTDESFRARENEEHHTGTSPFMSLPVNMIKFFPVDYMHQTCLGVMKRLIICWTKGPKAIKMSVSQKSDVNSRLLCFRSVVTKEFSRKPRPLTDVAHWKATEFRLFLVYSGYFVLLNNLKDILFDHFMCLSVAVSILLSDHLSTDPTYRQFAHELLLHFVSKSSELYGEEFLVYNVHSLVHLADEVEAFGKLDNSSAFLFENFMQHLKRMVRSARNPLVQVAHRLKERNMFGTFPVPVISTAGELKSIGCQSPNNCCILVDGRCCQVVSIGKDTVTCIVFANTDALYMKPCDSRILGIHKAYLKSGRMKVLPGTTLAYKSMCHTSHIRDCLIFVQLLHNV
jgi:hypothetical protein